ncbi:hypothetical protein [uncultured Methanolobus sp.]|uniref:hypothetical protein n=1 Tax=uncultured Methanolobus sp. TaxID=218300 RepID=UPI003747DEFF
MSSSTIPLEQFPEAEKPLMKYGFEIKAIIDDELSKSDRLMPEYEAVQIYEEKIREEKQRTHERMQTLQTRIAAIYKAGQYNGKYYWYFPAQVHVAVNNEHCGLDYTFDEVLTACVNLAKRRILFGKDFNEGAGVKYVYNTY